MYHFSSFQWSVLDILTACTPQLHIYGDENPSMLKQKFPLAHHKVSYKNTDPFLQDSDLLMPMGDTSPNGCVQKIKKALYGINGIYDLYIDFPQQKLTIIGWADPEKIVKAIRKTRKIATICSHTEPSDQPTETPQQAPEGGPPPPAANPPPAESQQAEAAPPAEPPKDPPQPENPPPEEKPSPSSVAVETNANQPPQNPGPTDVGEVHLIYHHPPDYGNRYGYGHSHSHVGQWNRYPNGQGLPPEPSQPIYVTHSYNTYRPSPYVTEYEHIRSPPRYTSHNRMSHYSDNYHSHNGSITSIFSDENPNACSIV